MLDDANIITGRTLDKLLADCPAAIYPDGIAYSPEGMIILVDGRPLDHEAEYCVTRKEWHAVCYPDQVSTIDNNWKVVRLSEDEVKDLAMVRTVRLHIFQPLATIADKIAGWRGCYPVVDTDGNLTGEVVNADRYAAYEATPCGRAVFATGIDL